MKKKNSVQEFPNFYERLGLNISYYRRKNRLSQAQLSEMVDINRTHMSDLERGLSAPSLNVVLRLCNALQISLMDLFTFRD